MYHRMKHTFTAGEISPLLESRADFERFRNGCRKLYNMYCLTQGPATRRPGFQFIYDLTSLGLDTANPLVREIPFIFSENQAYAMIFFMHTDGDVRLVFGTDEGLVVYDDPRPSPDECPPGTPVTPTPGDIVSLTFPTGWDIENFDWAQSADEMYFAQAGMKQHALKRYSHECWELVEQVFTAPPADWSVANGWPEKVTFHQQRLAYGANLIRPQTVWLSKAGSFLDFSYDSVNIKDDDAVTFTLDSGTQNRIQWMISGKSLNIGTLGNEWTVTGTNRAALTPTNILAQRQTNNGSEAIKPIMAGLTTLFIERHGRAVNEFVYDVNYDSYATSDSAILSPHLTELYSIIDWTHQQTPNSIIWCVRGDGDLLGVTYQRQHQVIGWHHHDTEGGFKAITSIPGNNREDDVWAIVHRVVNSQDKYYVEKMADEFIGDNPEFARFLDSHLVYLGTPTDTITGLDHLEGKTIDILADGTVHPSRVVVSGEVTLNDNYAHVVAGLGYISEVRPYVPDIGLDSGTTMGRTQRITNIDVDFYRSLGVYIGRVSQEDGESEEERAFRVPGDEMGKYVPLYTGIRHFDFPEGFDRKADYFIRQYQPLPLTVRGVIDTINVSE